MPEFWIQVENHAWDVCPNNIDRMMGGFVNSSPTPPVVTLTSPVTGFKNPRVMYKQLTSDAVIFRRYTANWAAPDDRRVNPWDLNEPDPTDTGTMGTIPGATLECSIPDEIVVHFRNMDTRTDPNNGNLLPAANRAHSLHPHGITFQPKYDGAFPLSPPDPIQPIVAPETAAWSSVGVSGFKQGDRVPAPTDFGQPGGTFDYHWKTLGWPTTAGVWLYHDHSICGDQNIGQGAIGALVIHNPADPQDVVVTAADLPGGVPNGPLWTGFCFPFPHPIEILPGHLNRIVTRPAGITLQNAKGKPIEAERLLAAGDSLLRLNERLDQLIEFCVFTLVKPPANAQYLQLYHQLDDAGMCINGRKYLGNTPTVIGGSATKMRFGLIGMGSDFHVFHLHGNRWIIPGPDGADLGAIEGSPQVRAVSQFEDSRTFGPANSFSFTIPQGTFFGASIEGPIGEWHMHCHVLSHMHDGMMGSLLIIKGGELFFFSTPPYGLPIGMACPALPSPPAGGVAMAATVHSTAACQWNDDVSGKPESYIMAGGSVTLFDGGGCAPGHTIVSDNTLTPWPAAVNQPVPATGTTINFPGKGNFGYHCGIHGGDPVGRTGMWGIVHVS